MKQIYSAKEESYCIARSFGAASELHPSCGFDFHQIRLLPSENTDTIRFSEHCQKAFAAPEVEQDLLEVGDSSLVEATTFHSASVSVVSFHCFIVPLFIGGSFLFLHSSEQAMVLSRSLHRQSDLYHRKIEGKVVQKSERIKELEEDVKSLKMLDDEQNLPKTTE